MALQSEGTGGRMIKKYWKTLLVAVGAFVSAAFYLFTPEAERIIERSIEPENGQFLLISEETVESADVPEPAVSDGGFTELQKEQIEEIVKKCISEEIEKSVAASVRTEITKLRDDGTLTEALYEYADSQSGLININKADAAELKSLPGIGDAKAASVIKYREENGDFKSIEELLNVSGISEKLLESIRNDITV